MSVEDERFDPSGLVPPWTKAEHFERYRFAAAYVPGAVVIDCACGSGEGTRLYAGNGATKVYAFDISEDAVESTRSRCSYLNNVEASPGSALSLPVEDSIADVFISLETFEHLDDQAAFLAEVARVLRPGGVFICSTPNRTVYSPGNLQASRPWNKFHVCEYSTQEFCDALGGSFEGLEIFGQNPADRSIEWVASKVSSAFGLTPAVRFKQILKLPRFLIPAGTRHAVVPAAQGQAYEFDVVVCRKPRG